MPIVDFAIITALTEEFKYLQQLIGSFEEITEGADTWYRTRLTADNGTNYELVLAWQDKMGPLPAQGLTIKMIDRWEPAYILLLGIAGQVEDEVKLGDIIVGQQIFYYDPQAVKTGGIEYRPEGYPGGVALVRQIHAVTVSPLELDRLRTAAMASAATKAGAVKLPTEAETARVREALNAHSPNVHVGTVASGSDVIKSDQKKKELKTLHGKILGTEMEGCGVMHAAFFHRENPSQALLIKGISDAANAEKSQLDAFGSWRELAKENSARMALAIISRGRLKATFADQFDLDTTDASVEITKKWIPDNLRRGFALLGFPRLVVPRGPLTRLRITLRTEDASGNPVALVKSVVEYASQGRYQTSELKGNPPQFEIEMGKVIDPQPVGVYLLLGRARKIFFEVSSASEKHLGQWIPEAHKG